nr:integrase, catalytic region, zinc finger, CCHC-type, peptidase aspartic, catalytic [Tanacetum cinerariifolium]
MIATPGEPDLPVPVPESFHKQTDEELTENDIKWMDADDQAIQTILLGLPEDVYAAVDCCETAKEIWERVRQMMKGSDIGKQEKKAKLFNEWEKFTSIDEESIKSYYHRFMQLMNDLKRNKHFPSGGNQNGLVVVPGISNHNGTGNVVAVRAEGDLDKKEEVNANCILMANLQHASTSGTQLDKALVYDTDGSAEVQLNDNYYDNKIFNMFTQEEQYTDLLDPISEPQLVPQNDNYVTSVASSMVQSGGTVETSFALNEETRTHQEIVYHNLVNQVAQEDKFLDKEVDLEAKIKDLKNILLKRDQTVQTMHMLNPKPDSFYHPNQEMALEVHKIISYEITPIINQVDARVQNVEIQFLQEAAKFVRDFKSLAKEADESLDKQKSLELEIERLLKASVSHDIMSIVQNGFVDVPSDLQTELDPYNDTQQKVERLQAQLRDLKGKSSDTPRASNTLDPLNQKLVSKIVELEFQVVNYKRKISHLKTTYKNLFDFITSNRAHAKLHNLIYENAQLRDRVFENTPESMNNTSGMSVTPHADKPKLSAVTPHSKKLHASIPSHSIPQPIEFNIVKHRNVIAPRMFKINPSQTSRVDLVHNKQSSASIRTNLITNSQRHVTFKENVSSDTVTASSTGLVHTNRTRRPQYKGNTRNARVPYVSKSSEVKKNVTVEDHHRTLLLSKNQKTMSSKCNNIKLAIRNDKSEIVCGTCCPNLSVVCRLGLFQAYDREHQASHQLFVEVFGKSTLWERPHCFYFGIWRNTCFIRDLDGVDLLKDNHFTNLDTINLYDMASASPICLMARVTPTKLWLWHQRLSHLNFDTINDLAKNDLVFGLPKFKYAKEHLCPSYEQGKSKIASHPPKPVSNLKQRLHLLHMDLCGPMRVASINGKRYVLVIVDDYSRYTWVHFLITKDETPEVIKSFLNKISVRL